MSASLQRIRDKIFEALRPKKHNPAESAGGLRSSAGFF
ncbi:MAG: hypothetical protein DKINENOH_04129 [bacterium]|nr:hypothetical protein [bacterium]